MVKFFKRLTLFIVVSFVLINTVFFLVLNSPIIQHSVINFINENYLKSQNLKLTLDSLSLSFFSAALNLNEVSIKEIKSENEDKRNFNFSLNQVSIGLDIPSSYLHRKPVVKKILLRGMQLNFNYDQNGKLILPDFLKSQDNSPTDLPRILGKIMPNLPSELDILNAIIILGNNDQKNYQYINVNLLEANKIFRQRRVGVAISANINGTFLSFPFLSSGIKINQLDLNGNLWQDGTTHIKKLNIDSNAVKLKSDINGLIMSKIEQSNYAVNIESLEIKGKDFFNLIGLKSDGTIKLVGNLKSGKSVEDFPTFIGNAWWEKLFLEGFSLYNGTADIAFKDRAVFYKRAKITTLKKGNITAEGKFELFGDFNFENLAHIESFSFAELLNGFGLAFSPVDFNIKSPEMVVDGKIFSKDAKKKFELYATGDAFASGMQVTTFDQKGRKPLPNFKINLNLSANMRGVYFDKSFISLPTKKKSANDSSEIHVPKGMIDLSPRKGVGVDVNLVGSNLDLSGLEYFLKLPTSGIADLNGSIKVVAPSTEVNFQANSTAMNGELLGLKYNKIVGEWGLDSKGISVKNVQVNSGLNADKLANIFIEKVRFNFADSRANIVATVSGELNGLMSSISYWVPGFLTNTSGFIDSLSVQLDGLLFHPSSWNLKASSNIKDLKILNGGMGNFDLNLSCHVGNCQKSYLVLNTIYANPLPSENLNEEVDFGQVLFQMDNLSFVNSAFKVKITQFPLRFFDVNNSMQLDGSLDSNAAFSGVWGNIEGSEQTEINEFKIGSMDFDDLHLNMSPTDHSNLKFELLAFNNQFKSIFTIPQQGKLDSKLDLILNNFDITQILSDEVRANNDLFSQLTGQFTLHGNLTAEIWNDPIHLLSQWVGEGNLTKAVMQYERVILNLKEKGAFTLSENKLNIPNLFFASPLLNIETNGLVDLSNKTLSLPINVGVDFSKLKSSFPNIFDDPSSGSAHAKLLLSGGWDDLHFDGGLSLSAKSITLKNYPPSLTDLNGEINFQNKSIEIQKIAAHKGNGDISIAGNIDYSNLSPNINLRVNASKADFRIQVPIFAFADIDIDSDINITGQGRPYLINGDVNVHKFQMIRDLTCNQISTQALALPKVDQTIVNDPFVNLDLNIKATNSINIRSQCLTGRFSTEPDISVTGTNNDPKINGTISAETATLQILKTSFEVKKAEFQFVDVQKYDPNVDIQMRGRVNTYNIYWKMNGRLSQARLNLSADPPVLPNGDRIIEPDIISMISTGQVPPASSTANILSASSGVASFLGINNFFESTLNQTVNTVTGGLVETVSFTPSTQNGQLSWRANASRSVSQRLNIGVIYEDGNAGNTKTAYANYMFNDTVSAISSYNATNYVQQIPTQELYSGLRFQFGSQ